MPGILRLSRCTRHDLVVPLSSTLWYEVVIRHPTVLPGVVHKGGVRRAQRQDERAPRQFGPSFCSDLRALVPALLPRNGVHTQPPVVLKVSHAALDACCKLPMAVAADQMALLADCEGKPLRQVVAVHTDNIRAAGVTADDLVGRVKRIRFLLQPTFDISNPTNLSPWHASNPRCSRKPSSICPLPHVPAKDLTN